MSEHRKIELSPLGHTWILDLDGTLVKHNGYLVDGHDTLLKGAKQLLGTIPKEDLIIFLTSRTQDTAQDTEKFLMNLGIRYDQIIYNAPYGERILLNDRKLSGLETAKAVNVNRDEPGTWEICIQDRKSVV